MNGEGWWNKTEDPVPCSHYGPSSIFTMFLQNGRLLEMLSSGLVSFISSRVSDEKLSSLRNNQIWPLCFPKHTHLPLLEKYLFHKKKTHVAKHYLYKEIQLMFLLLASELKPHFFYVSALHPLQTSSLWKFFYGNWFTRGGTQPSQSPSSDGPFYMQGKIKSIIVMAI